MVQPTPRPCTLTPNGTILAFDFGLKRIGVAVGDMETRLAHALTSIDAGHKEARFAAIAKLVADWHPVRLVIGLPLSMVGDEHELSARSRRFANHLRERFGLPADLVDERLTSVDAEGLLRQTGLNWRQRKARLDAAAAQVILQSYFDAASRR